MKRIFIIYLLFLIPQFAHANKFSTEFRYWIQHPIPNIEANAQKLGSYKADEALELSEAPEIEFRFRPANKNYLKANFAWLTYGYSKREDKIVKPFLISTEVRANLTISRFSLGWEYNLFKSEHFEFNSLLDMKFAWLKYTLIACNHRVYGIPVGELIPEVSEKDEIVMFLPSAGIHVSVLPIKNIRINLEISGSHVGSYSGIDFGTSLSVPIFNHLAFTGGYKLMYFTFDHEKIKGNLLTHGATIGMKLMF